MENIDFRAIVLILFLVISAIKWVGERFAGSKTPEAQQPDTQSSSSLEDIYEQYREQIHQRQRNVNQEPEQVEALQIEPVLTETLAHPPISSPPMIQENLVTQKPTLTREQKEALQKFEALSKKKQRSQKNKDTNTSIKSLLTSPGSAKQAVILTEILGKPKSMQKSSYGY